MKIKSSKVFFGIAAAIFVVLSISAYAVSPKLSPSLEILGKGVEMNKCGVINNDVTFKPSDFEGALGVDKVEYITVTALPDSSSGVLKIAGVELLKDQTISRKNLDLLKFVPNYNTLTTGKFSFKNAMDDNSPSATCMIHILKEINLAPETVSQVITTQKNVSVSKFVKAADPENDKINLEVTKYPENGKVKILDETAGAFRYQPKSGFTGKDEFTYTVTDQYGNKSEPKTITMRVTKPLTEAKYDDLATKGHWAYNSALRMTSMGLMSGKKVDGKLNFNPDEPMSRGDFLAMAMIVTGHEKEVEPCYSTVFADDNDIPLNIKSYAEKAMSMGVVSGYPTEAGGVDFDPVKPVSRAEASVILDRLIENPKPKISPEFTDAAAIPTWAKDSISSLASCGILNGTGYGEIQPQATVTKAEAAEMLCNTIDYVENKSEPAKEKKSIFNLFGLLS